MSNATSHSRRCETSGSRFLAAKMKGRIGNKFGELYAEPAPCVFQRGIEVGDSVPWSDTDAPGYESQHRC